MGGGGCASRLLGWVPGHVDVDGNDCADELAKRGASVSERIFSGLWSYLGPHKPSNRQSPNQREIQRETSPAMDKH